MIHTFSANPSLLSGKPALTSFRKFSVQLPIGWLGAVTPRRSLPTRPDREGRAVHLAGSRTRSVAAAYRLFDPGYCRSLDLSMTYKFCDRNYLKVGLRSRTEGM